MANKLPWIFSGSKVCIICEGDEEYEYLDKLISLDVWNENYKFTLENAEGNGNIPARYQDKYQNGSYDVVLVFCDTDRKPYEQYVDIKRKINEFHGVENAADKVVIYGNPCTMQIILSHFAVIKLTSQSKAINSKYIKEYIGIDNYKATENQRKELFSKIKRSNYEQMKKNVAKLSTNDNVASSTNILKFIGRFEDDDESWIDEINKRL